MVALQAKGAEGPVIRKHRAASRAGEFDVFVDEHAIEDYLFKPGVDNFGAVLVETGGAENNIEGLPFPGTGQH